MGRKNRNCDKESTLIDRLKRENARLKRDYAKLRKQVDRLNIDHERYRTLRELVHKQTQEERAAKKDTKDWTCHSCGKGRMKIVILSIPGNPKYFRKCTICDNRTKSKNYTSEVEDS